MAPKTSSRNFSLELLSQSSSYPFITHNESIIILSAILSGAKGIITAVPTNPTEEDLYLIAASGTTGILEGYENRLVIYLNSAWKFLPPPEAGQSIFVNTTPPDLLYWDGSQYASVATVGGGINSFENSSTGVAIAQSILDGSLKLRSLVQGLNISITQNTDHIIISTPTHQRVSTNTQTLTDNLTLTVNSANYQYLNPGGSDRNIILPEAEDGLHFIIKNTAPTNALFIKESNNDLVQELSDATFYLQIELICSSNTWHGHALLGGTI